MILFFQNKISTTFSERRFPMKETGLIYRENESGCKIYKLPLIPELTTNLKCQYFNDTYHTNV